MKQPPIFTLISKSYFFMCALSSRMYSFEVS
nr:MAG TPA: hypothetical protein [Bacteriophage sp.]